jgi:hypothetical protein
MLRLEKKNTVNITGQIGNINEPHILYKQPVATRTQETNQVATAKIVRNTPPTQEFTPLGYNRENILDRIARADTWGFNVGLDPNFVEEYSPTGKIAFESYVRSISPVNGIASNNFIWDPIPELENFPVSGFPNQVSQQYVLFNVKPTWQEKALNKVNVHAQSVPTAYNTATNTTPQVKGATYVYQTPITEIQNNISGLSFFQRLKQILFGGE